MVEVKAAEQVLGKIIHETFGAWYKLGDIVEISRNVSGHPFQIGDEVKIFRILKDGYLVDVCHLKSGDCATVYASEFKENNKVKAMKTMKQAVTKVAKELLKPANQVTTLEVKLELRKDFPYYYWTQDIVSTFMAELADEGVLTFTDNGTYRIYSLAGTIAPTAGPVSTQVLTKTVAPTVIGKSKNRKGKVKTDLNIVDAEAKLRSDKKNFEEATLVDGTVVTSQTIRGQKKSPIGALEAKLYNGKVSSLVFNGVVYSIK